MDRPHHKLLGLEILRFACAIAVVIYHYRHFAELPGMGGLASAAFPLGDLLAPVYEWGHLGVQFFWLISGFVFFHKYGAAIAERRVSPRKFFWLRFSRLYPLHLVTLLLVAALLPVHVLLTGRDFVFSPNDAPHFLLNLAMATHWGTMAPMTFNGPFWSVSAEVMVYAAFFAIVWRFGSSIMLCGSMMMLAMVMTMSADLPVAFCALMFFAGGLTALQFERHGRRRGAPAVSLTLLIGALVAIGLATANGVELAPRLLALAVGPQLLFLAARDWPLLGRFAVPIEAAGNVTYSTYLCHFPMQLMLAIAVAATGVSIPLTSPLFLAAYIGAVLVVGHVVYERFERPSQDWIRAATLSPRPRRKAA